MSDVLIVRNWPTRVNKYGVDTDDLYIDGEFQHDVTGWSITWKINHRAILKIDRLKLDKGHPYTIGCGYVAMLTEYYPVHSLEVRDAD